MGIRLRTQKNQNHLKVILGYKKYFMSTFCRYGRFDGIKGVYFMISDKEVIKKVIDVLEDSVNNIDISVLKRLEQSRNIALSARKGEKSFNFSFFEFNTFKVVSGFSMVFFLGVFSYMNLTNVIEDDVSISTVAILEDYNKLYESCDYYKLNSETDEITVNTSC